jgi:hypothetical protein
LTSTINGSRPDVTVGDDVRVCVRASEIPGQAAVGPDSAPESAYTRAIPHDGGDRPPAKPSKVRDFLSLHKGATQGAVESSWFGRERPSSLYDAAGDVFPARGEAGNAAVWMWLSASGLLRLTGLAACYLAAFCFDTRIRATASTVVIAAAITVHNVLS